MSEHANLTGWLSQDRCPGCGYSLAGHASPEVCPECAMSFAGVPGGALWWARERFRLMSVTSGLVALTTLAMLAEMPMGASDVMAGSEAMQWQIMKSLGGGAFFTNLSLYVWCLAGLLLAMALPKPRPVAVIAAAVACGAYPVAVLFERAVYDDFLATQVALRWNGGGGGAIDMTLVIVRMVASALAPMAAGLLLIGVCAHLRAVGLAEISQRFGWCGRLGMILLPTMIVLTDGIQLYFSAGPGGGVMPMAGGGGRGAARLLMGGSSGGGGFDTVLALLGPVQMVLTGLLLLILAYCAARLCLRARWMLESHPAG